MPASRRTQAVCCVQIVGPIETDLLPVAIRQAILQARKSRADLLVVELDTPGGRTFLSEQICACLDRAGIRTAAFVRMGQHRGAFSAGAVIALACDDIVMAPGTSIGAAPPMLTGGSMPPQVTAKTILASSAVARAIAARHGHPPLVAAAMIDPNVELREVVANRKRFFLPPEQAEAMSQKGAALGGWLTRRGELLTLTAAEAEAVGLTKGTASSREEMCEMLGMASARLYAGSAPP